MLEPASGLRGKDIVIRGHLGLGDHIVCNAIVRHYARVRRQVVVFCKRSNQPSLAFLWRDVPNIRLHPVENDEEARGVCRRLRAAGVEVMGLGGFGTPPFNADDWDREMYRQAGIDYRQRWEMFRVERDPSREFAPPDRPFVFVHDDPARGFAIPPDRLPAGVHVIRPDPATTPVLFDYLALLENAREIHCIDSCFAILVDCLDYRRNQKLVWHRYARRGRPPNYRKAWNQLA